METADEEQAQELDEELEDSNASSLVSRKARQDYAATFGAARYAKKG